MKTTKIINTLKLNDEALDKAVKIQGTDYDRKRKVKKSDVKMMKKLYKKGYSYSAIASVFGVSYSTVKYNIDDNYRLLYNFFRDGTHTGKTHLSKSNRVSYKRELVANGVI